MGSVCLFVCLFACLLAFCRFFGVAYFALWTLIGSRPDDTYALFDCRPSLFSNWER